MPDFGSRVLSASAVVAYVAVGAAAILSRSVTEVAQDALAWVLPRDAEIVVEGRAPEGTTFSLLLPVSAQTDRTAPRERAENGRP